VKKYGIPMVRPIDKSPFDEDANGAPILTKVKSSFNKLDIPLRQQIVDDFFILSHRNGTSTVNHAPATLLTLGIQSINSCQQQLLLQMSTTLHIRYGTLDLDTWIARDDAKPTTRSIQQDAIKLITQLPSNLTSVIATSDDIPHS
jgi:hypothetical protein